MDTRASSVQRHSSAYVLFGHEKAEELPSRYLRTLLGSFRVFTLVCACNVLSGPKWLPVLGSALTVNSLRKQTGYLYRATICLAESYGPIVGLKVGKDRQVVCCGYNAIKEMLTKEEFDGRPQGPFYETRTWGTRRGTRL